MSSDHSHQVQGHAPVSERRESPNNRCSSASSSSSPTRPPWSSHHRRNSSAARLSHRSRYARASHSHSHSTDLSLRDAVQDPRAFIAKGVSAAQSLGETVLATFWRLPPLHRALAVLAVVAAWVLVILMLLYSGAIFLWLAEGAKALRELPFGWLLTMGLVGLTAIPPLFGYSTSATICGFVYGFPLGWPIAAVGATLGSLVAFAASRTVLSGFVDRMVGKDKRFIALGEVLRRDGIWYLTGFRFAPFPFSLSNGFLATIPTITPLSFTISTALSTPKLLVYTFIGSRLAVIAEGELSFGDRLVNYLAMAVCTAIGFSIGIIIYRRTMARAAELAQEDQQNGRTAENGEAGYRRRSGFYNDDEEEGGPLMDPEDAADVLGEDDLSLWDAQSDDYRDDDDDEEAKKQNQMGR